MVDPDGRAHGRREVEALPRGVGGTGGVERVARPALGLGQDRRPLGVRQLRERGQQQVPGTRRDRRGQFAYFTSWARAGARTLARNVASDQRAATAASPSIRPP